MRPADAASVLLGAFAAGFAGAAALPGGWSGPRLARFSACFLLGLALVVPATLVWGLAGLPWNRATLPWIALALGMALRVAGRRGKRPVPSPDVDGDDADWPAARAALLLCALALAVAAWKWWSAPLWSWDHFAIWGVKARRLVVDGAFDLAFLGPRSVLSTNPDYPLGLPLSWRFLSPERPEAGVFRLCHTLFGLSLLGAFYGAARRLRGSRLVGGLLAAALAASPLFWDSEALGLAELPLAAAACAGVLLAAQAREDPGFPAWPAGVTLGFLAWLKLEGLPLGALLAAAAAVLIPTWRRKSQLLLAWGAWALAALAIRRYLLPPGVGFFEGDWLGRVRGRSPNLGALITLMAERLSGAEWFGLWIAFAAAVLAALVLRRRAALVLGAAVLGQLSVYAVVYLGTFLDPFDHFQASFHRVAAALVPLAALAIAAATAQRGRRTAT